MPSDHKINEKNKFQNAIKQSAKICEENKIITFGIEPNEPDTNFGYIKKGKIIDSKNKIFVADKFEEKPSLNKAKEYLKNKKFLWNSGIFFCKAKIMLNEIAIYDKKTFTNSINAVKKANKDLVFLRLSKKYFSKTNAKPIDIAVLEKSKEVALKVFKVGWYDVGSWPSIYNLSKKKGGNVLKGSIETMNVENSLIHSQNQQVMVIEQKNLVVISTKDALLIMPNNKSTNIKRSIENLSKTNKETILFHPKVYRPWGSFDVLLTKKNYQVKKLIINPQQKISLQKHLYRSENWIVVQGRAKITKNNKNYILTKNQSISIPKKTIHRVENIGKDPVIIIEVQSGEKLLEGDIIRLEDIYNRD